MSQEFPDPPDQAQRDLILKELDRCMLVEAAAGTGKTASIVGRMVALLAGGACADVGAMVAVTFTRKAASELRARFQIALEGALREAGGDARERLADALSNIEQCFIGTIHSFCARLLRERPVEAAVDLAFEEIDDDVDQVLREEAWRDYCSDLVAGGSGALLGELENLGISLTDLEQAFTVYADYPDVQEWPASRPEVPPGFFDDAARAVEDYAAHMADLAPRLPRKWKNDELIRKYRVIPRAVSHYDDLRDPRQLCDLLAGQFEKGGKQIQSDWMKDGQFTKEEAKDEKRRWDEFREDVVIETLRVWRELRYGPVVELLADARLFYERRRAAAAQLNFQDLLMKAAALLRDKPHVRRYFTRRYTHVLVDEFQDTDPVQAEVLMLLTAADPAETDWRRCSPRPGSLFVVGDPKQSIYRFRRADIITYDEVKRIILKSGGGQGAGLLVELSANFRAATEVLDWVNEMFAPEGDSAVFDEKGEMLRFPGSQSEESPAYVPLRKGRHDGNRGTIQGVMTLNVGEEAGNRDTATEIEADTIARYVTAATSTSLPATVSRTAEQLAGGSPEQADTSDFMVITRATKSLSTYARKLQEYGIPHQVTGGSALNELEELRLLRACLAAVMRPDDPVALLSVLRGELFGMSDAALYRFKRSGGRFDYNSTVPGDLPPDELDCFTDAFKKLRSYRGWLARLPAVSAIERMVADLGLMALASAKPGGDVQAGSMGKVLELIREFQHESWSAVQVLDFLDDLITPGRTNKHDGVTARSMETPAVRLMNLHKVKGLEAPVVFLANAYGDADHMVLLHVDRQADVVRGYMMVYGKDRGRAKGPLIAQPPGWESLAAREKAFQAAEQLRLRYVAATRAGSAVVVTERPPKRNSNNAWRFFAPYLEPDNALADPGPQEPRRPEVAIIDVREVAAAAAAIAARRDQVAAKTYEVLAAKEHALSGAFSSSKPPGSVEGDGGEPPGVAPDLADRPFTEGEHGVERGQVIHQLLELAMRDPDADLLSWAGSFIEETGMSLDSAREMADTARSVCASDIWKRAAASGAGMSEVPFEIMLEDAEVPTLVRGAIDLVFPEDGGWVLVDYKTDRITSAADVEALAAHYIPQLEIYSQAWERCIGETVKETGLYFTSINEYRPLSK